MKKYSHGQVIGIPVGSSRTYAEEELLGDPSCDGVPVCTMKDRESCASGSKQSKDSVVGLMSRFSKKAHGIREHVMITQMELSWKRPSSENINKDSARMISINPEFYWIGPDGQNTYLVDVEEVEMEQQGTNSRRCQYQNVCTYQNKDPIKELAVAGL
ncbi:GEM-like protein 7 [Carex littledalei]|uniref:GEM-like protein 7 n=1 Tax=Carex littledalei TaxID=544730 RepID=A0A833V175_9POAL|nr:GEM-like protein 7 [Carex littledalei]